MVTVDLPSIPAGLMESELFGFERGAFTAPPRPAGKLELRGRALCTWTTSVSSPTLQAKLLRVVEDRRFERLSNHASLEARIVASASADLVQAVEGSSSAGTLPSAGVF
jgi:DNA-binding NtrC family response regulator